MRTLDKLLDDAKTLEATGVQVTSDGSLELVPCPPDPEPVVALTEDGVELQAGDRLSLALKQHKSRGMLTSREMADQCGLSEERYSQLETGANLKLPDDMLERIAQVLGLTASVVRRMADLDLDYPIRYAGSSYSSPSY